MSDPTSNRDPGSFLPRLWRKITGKPSSSSSPAAMVPSEVPALPPDYLRFFGTAERMSEFEKLIRRYFERRKVPIIITDGYVECTIRGEKTTLGLDNVAASCAHSSEDSTDEFAAVIAAYFDVMMRSFDAEARTTRDLQTFDQAKSKLIVLLYPAREVSAEIKAYRREKIEGIEEFLAIDIGESVQTLNPEVAEKWGQRADSLFDLAWANTVAAARPESTIELLEGAIFAMQDDSIFGAARTIAEDGLSEHHGAFGAIVSMPTKHVSLIAPFNGLDVLGTIPAVIQMSMGLFSDGPKSLSPNVYWVRAGRWIRIPFEINNEKLGVTPPEDLVELLNSLGDASN